jgi:glutathione S-transferase
VPSLRYNGETITESAIIAQFLADAHPSHLVLPSNAPGGALQRARIGFFVDASISQVVANLVAFIGAKTDAEGATHIEAYIEGVVKELEPLLKDAKPFFGGSDNLTLAEVSTFAVSQESSFTFLRLIEPLGSHWFIRHSFVSPFQDRGDPEQLGITIEGEGAGLLRVGSGRFSPSKCYWDF